MADFCDLFVSERIVIDLFPFAVFVAVVLGALGDKQMKVGQLLLGGMGEATDDLDEELIEFLPRDGANFEMVEALCQQLGDVVSDRGLSDV